MNYNYDLGFNVDRYKLAEIFNNIPGYSASFDNTINHMVSIKKPYYIPPEHDVLRKKDKVKCNSFRVYKTGLVTQSGPNEDIMEPAYIDFNQIIMQIRDQIEREGGEVTLRFREFTNEKQEMVQINGIFYPREDLLANAEPGSILRPFDVITIEPKEHFYVTSNESDYYSYDTTLDDVLGCSDDE
ncbi:hypothetical protein D3C87_1325950 [compost metagenome]